MKIADMPIDERPAERLAKHGAATLSDSELLAVLTGARDLESMRVILRDGLRPEPMARNARKASKGAEQKILAAAELARRLAGRIDDDADPVGSPEILARALIARYSHHLQERLGAVYLDAKNRIICEREIYIGTINSTTVSTRDVIRIALEVNAAACIIFHNHPSGDPGPSAEDLLFTRRMRDAGKIMGVEVLDHLILGANRYVSLAQRGHM